MSEREGHGQGKAPSRRALTDRLIASLEPPERGRSRIVWDDKLAGFGIRVTCVNGDGEDATGNVRSFIFNYRNKLGTERRITIGRFQKPWTTTAARKRAGDLRKLVDEGGDPKQEEREARDAPTMAELCERYLEEVSSSKRPRTRDEEASIIRQIILPELGNRKAHDITTEDIERLHRKVSLKGIAPKDKDGNETRAARPAPVRANRTVALLRHMFNCARRWKIRTDNPALGLKSNQEQKRTTYLDHEQVARLVAALAKHQDKPSANAIKLLLLTGARRNEVLTATWDQFHFASGLWTKPGATTKQKSEHKVPLSAPALQLVSEMKEAAEAGEARAAQLERQAKLERRPAKRERLLVAAKLARLRAQSSYLFPSPAGEKPQTEIRRVWRRVCQDAGIEGVRLHDLRHSYASLLVSAGLSLPIVGALLGHSQPGTTARYAHLMTDPLRAATERVGALVSAAENGKPTAEVKAFPKRKR